MSALELYANQIRYIKGTMYMSALESLRAYIRLTTEEELNKYINMITDPDILRILIAAGMRGTTHKTTISRLNLLMKEQEEAKK